jgi:hypothetical protein
MRFINFIILGAARLFFCTPCMDVVSVLLFVEVETQFACPSTHDLVHTSKMGLTHLELESLSTDRIQGAGCWCSEVFKVPLGIHSRPSFSLYPLVGYMCWSPWILLFGLFFFWVYKPYNNKWRNTCESLTPLSTYTLSWGPGSINDWILCMKSNNYPHHLYLCNLPVCPRSRIQVDDDLIWGTASNPYLCIVLPYIILYSSNHSSVACLWWHHCFLLF